MALHCSPCARSDDARYFQFFMYAVHQRAIERVKLLDDAILMELCRLTFMRMIHYPSRDNPLARVHV
jgi:hypothetical protein